MANYAEMRGTLEGFDYKITRNTDCTHIIEDTYSTSTYEFTAKAWWEMWNYYFHAQSGLSVNEFAVMLCRSGLVFLILNREYINGYHHQRFWVTDKEEDKEEYV